MKTAEEWVKEYGEDRTNGLLGNPRKLKHRNGDYIRAIQLDAYKAGMTDSAKLCEVDQTLSPPYHVGAGTCKRKIIIARDAKDTI